MKYLKKKYIPSGEYFISKSSPLVLQAILGTCVGVALYDTENDIGGIIHLLLPEPVSMYHECNPERYASTGLPIFINALLESGACKENMKATVAGGALVGPVTEHDLSLDIGGHTADIVKKILKQNHITIEKSETGGFFSCCLALNFHQWKTDIEPVGVEQFSQATPITAPEEKTVDIAIENLLPIPQVALKVLRIMNDDDFDMSLVSEEVRKDQVLTARALKLCNSANFALRMPIESIEDALILLGKNLFIQTILTAAIENYFNQCGLGYSICKGGLFHHAVGTAVIAEKLALNTGKAAPRQAYIAGLMHDIGKVVLDQYITLTYPFLYRNPFEKDINLIDIERKTIGFDHTEVGYLLANQWGIPEYVTDTIKYHHYPLESNEDDFITFVVFLADLLMSRFHSGLEVERMQSNDLKDILDKLKLSPSQFSSVVDMIPGYILKEQGADVFM